MNAAERHDARVSILAADVVHPMPWIYHEYSLWFGTTKEELEGLDAGAIQIADDMWPNTVHGSDVDPHLGVFIANATVGYPAALDEIDRLREGVQQAIDLWANGDDVPAHVLADHLQGLLSEVRA